MDSEFARGHVSKLLHEVAIDLGAFMHDMTSVVMEHGHSLVILPNFDGSNYAYWKFRMKAFLKSLDERVWLSVENSW